MCRAVIQYPDDLCFPDPQRYTAFLSWNGFSLSPTDGLPTKEQPLELLKPSGLNHIPPGRTESSDYVCVGVYVVQSVVGIPVGTAKGQRSSNRITE